MDINLHNLLKEKRKEIALREGKELYKIFHNATLERTAEAMPKTKLDLEKIKGWGQKKIEKYGDEILAVINANESKPEPLPSNRLFTVQELISFVNFHFSNLGVLKVRGEITEVNRHPNGYCFFTIKDQQTQDHSVSCFVSNRTLAAYDHLLETGMEVMVSAVPSLYKNGRFSLTVNKVEPYGEGALKKAFEALKAKLEAKGYFDLARKRPIPSFVKKIGLITSDNGAAIRDFRQNLGEYGFEIYFIDVRVEGDFAEQSVIGAINWLNKNKPDLDLLVLVRGGGSLESLKAFNSEAVANAIVLSRLPVITGIGHEKDESIADYVADLRCSTPTAVASFIKQGIESLIHDLTVRSDNLIMATEKVLETWNEKVGGKQLDLVRAYATVLQRYKFLILNAATQIQTGLERIFSSFRTVERNFTDLFYQQQRIIQTHLHRTETWIQTSRRHIAEKFHSLLTRLAVAEGALTQLNPEAVLKKGYSIVYKASRVIMQARDVRPKDQIKIRLHRGTITSLVEEVDN